MKSKVMIVLLISLFPALAQSQTDIQMSQHIFNRSLYNPASAEISKDINIFGHWRDQWQDWCGAPQTVLVSANGYVPSCKFGLGMVILKDKLGFEHDIQCKFTYSYHIFLKNKKTRLSLGLSAGVVNKNIKWNDAVAQEQGNIPTEPECKWKADFDFGLEFNIQ
ncbi:MAG: PorP/SprF family type IX secretion system membrane protein, partial [Prevotellaceae bacterium]|nr:PorP/SprF family type IX secretion system membrane protein [Prevotellaceae bacterium]